MIGISGSPIQNSNTDRLIKQVLDASGLESEFVKLSDIQVGPCRACKACASDNTCKITDDFPNLSQKILDSPAMIIGGYTPYGMLDAFTKSLLERFWSMRHINSLNEDKIVLTVISSLQMQTAVNAHSQMDRMLSTEKMNHVAQLTIKGNVPCLTCGYGDPCVNSGVKRNCGMAAKATSDLCVAVETQSVWEEATKIGALIGEYLRGGEIELPSVSGTPLVQVK